VTSPAADPAPLIRTQPASQMVTAGQTANFAVAADGTAPLLYQWQKNGAEITGATSSSFTTPPTTTADNRTQFAVTITNKVGSVTSNTATLTVTAADVGPSFVSQPVGQTTATGQTATFSVTAAGTAPLIYQWNKNGTTISGATSPTYTTPPETIIDSGVQFTVVVSNTVGSITSNAATLTVNAAAAPSITSQPVGQTTTAGQTATFSVVASGTAPLSYQWNKNGVGISGATSSSYTTPAETTADNSSQFTVVVSNAAGSVTSGAATLTVNAAAVAPSIISQPLGQTITTGQTATFSVSASGTAPLSYQWYKNGTGIGGATSSSYTTPAETTADNGAQFTVVLSNNVGNLSSNAAILTVTPAPVAPTITTQPASRTITLGQTATFSVIASGTSPLSYQWNKNGTAISGATSSTYVTPATIGSDNGAQFTVTVSNSAGTVTSNPAILTVNTPPSITSQPASQTLIAGQTATFSAAATGTAPLSYQWQKNGTPIGGANSASYTTGATTTSDNGAQFIVVVSNTAGSITSSPATLTVNAATYLISASPASLSFGNINTGTSSTLTVTLTNSGNSSVTISNVSVSGAGFNATGVSTGTILTSGQTATLNVTFAPAAAGNVTGNIAVVSNASNSPATIAFSGTGVQVVSPSVDLTWTASTSVVLGYNVYRSAQSGGPYTKLSTTLVTLISYIDSVVQSGQTYFYVVTAVDSANVESVYSNDASAVIP
jgi:hypothetical protein